MMLFVDQSGQLGGAELCLADIAAHYQAEAKVLLLSDGPFADLLRQRNIEVVVLPLPASAASATKQASMLSTARSLPALFAHLMELKAHFKGTKVAYLNTAKALLLGNLAGLLAGVPCIFHLHDLLDHRHFNRINLALLVASANRSKAVIANSQATADQFFIAGGRAPVHVIPNGFDIKAFDSVSQVNVSTIRTSLNPENQPVAAIFGRLSRWKGQDVLLRAAAQIPELLVWIVGDALFTEDDRQYADELKTTAAQLGGRVQFLGFRHDVPELMHAADMIVHCSVLPEPFGRVLVEGMLAAKPVVATRAGGPTEIVEDKITGLLVKPGNDLDLAEKIKLLAGSAALRNQMGTAGRKRAENLYSLPTTLKKIHEVITSVAPS